MSRLKLVEQDFVLIFRTIWSPEALSGLRKNRGLLRSIGKPAGCGLEWRAVSQSVWSS